MIAVAVILTGLLMPAFRQVHENAQRVVCMANLQQIGHAFILYGNDHNDQLPHSDELLAHAPHNLMISRRTTPHGDSWDGIGRLYALHYCDAAACFYCPSHRGRHPFERYEKMWTFPAPGVPIFTNYHYAGHVDWVHGSVRRSLLEGNRLVLATDGLRSSADFNHVTGMNVLRADGSVRWKDDTENIYNRLPVHEGEVTPAYHSLWEELNQN